MKRAFKTFILGAALSGLIFAGVGCSTTTESENHSSRPWNSPRGWEYGIPGMMPQYGR